MATTIIERPHKYCFSANQIRYVFSVSEPAAPGCSVEIQLYYHAINDPTSVGVLLNAFTLYPYADGLIYCDVKNDLKSVLDFQLPEINGAVVTPIEAQAKYFYIKFREVTEANDDPAWTNDIAERGIVILGGVEQMKFKRNNFFVTYLGNTKPFLTWQPSHRFVFYDQRHYLTFLLTEAVTAFKVFYKIVYTDGGSNENASLIPTDDNILFRLKTGAKDILLDTPFPGRQIHYYEIKVTDEAGTTILANPYRFYLDYRPVYFFYDLVYFNSISGLDSVRIKGEVSWSVENSFDEVSHIPYNDAVFTDRPQEQYSQANVFKRDTFKGDAGWSKTKQEQEALIEMFLHPIYEIVDGRWIRVNNLKKSQDLRATTDKKWSFPVEWTYGYDDPVFTPKELSLGAGSEPVIIGATCTNVTLPSYTFTLPDAQVGVPYIAGFGLGGSAPFALSNIVKPAWMTIEIDQSYWLRFIGTPDATATNLSVSVTITNCNAAGSVTFTDTIDVITAGSGGGGGTPPPTGYTLIFENLTGASLMIKDINGTWITLSNFQSSTITIASDIEFSSLSFNGTGLELNFFDQSNAFISSLSAQVGFAGSHPLAFNNNPAPAKIQFTLVA